ncbi:uncharacterized protein LOC141849596 [Brevipalpus obovatus]|uniref:uncharacterized protein LOC141849596 n=1 Tax=Brevipalpus obovatus TaxID=246614 RepID=UPI003D9F5917
MDNHIHHGNYKTQEVPPPIYNPISSEEIALRFTILELVEKLKRTQLMCNYYEQCRSELVNDCIRLRRERDYYLMANRSQLQRNDSLNRSKIEQLPPGDSELSDNASSSSNTHKNQQSFQFDNNEVSPDDDENYEEIAKKLIEKFRNEMEANRVSLSDTSSTAGGRDNDNSRSSSLHRREEMAKDSTTSKLPLFQFPREPKDSIRDRRNVSRNLTRDDAREYQASSSDAKDFNVQNSSPAKSGHLKRSVVTINGPMRDTTDPPEASTIIEVNQNRNAPTLSSTEADSSNNNPESNQYIELCNRVLQSAIADFEAIAKILVNQNDKLKRHKEKQLRSYFRRQLDVNNDNINAPKKQ